MKKIPMRKCIVSNQSYPKQELIRIVINKEQEVSVDVTGKAHGRGVYVYKNCELVTRLIKHDILSKKLGVEVSSEVYQTLQALCCE